MVSQKPKKVPRAWTRKMKKTLSILLCIALCICSSCERDKDEHGHVYFKTKGQGYAFYRSSDGATLIPCAGHRVTVENCDGDHSLLSIFEEHYDYFTTDNNGFYTCRFVKDNKNGEKSSKKNQYIYLSREDMVSLPENSLMYGFPTTLEISYETLKNAKEDIKLDTIFIGFTTQ